MTIRKATLADVPSLQQLCALLCEKEQAEYDSTISPQWPFSADGKKYFSQRIRSGFGIVAVEKKEIVGYCVGSVTEPISYREQHKTAELESMFVKEEYRSKGLGGKMAVQFLDWSKKNKAMVIRVHVSAGNKKGIEFYSGLGFKLLDVHMEINPYNRLMK
jgi:ribosomal protein S18 acetylase RimI-like enzyme